MNPKWYVVLNLDEGPTTYQIHCDGKIVALDIPSPEEAEAICAAHNEGLPKDPRLPSAR